MRPSQSDDVPVVAWKKQKLKTWLKASFTVHMVLLPRRHVSYWYNKHPKVKMHVFIPTCRKYSHRWSVDCCGADRCCVWSAPCHPQFALAIWTRGDERCLKTPCANELPEPPSSDLKRTRIDEQPVLQCLEWEPHSVWSAKSLERRSGSSSPWRNFLGVVICVPVEFFGV